MIRSLFGLVGFSLALVLTNSALAQNYASQPSPPTQNAASATPAKASSSDEERQAARLLLVGSSSKTNHSTAQPNNGQRNSASGAAAPSAQPQPEPYVDPITAATADRIRAETEIAIHRQQNEDAYALANVEEQERRGRIDDRERNFAEIAVTNNWENESTQLMMQLLDRDAAYGRMNVDRAAQIDRVHLDYLYGINGIKNENLARAQRAWGGSLGVWGAPAGAITNYIVNGPEAKIDGEFGAEHAKQLQGQRADLYDSSAMQKSVTKDAIEVIKAKRDFLVVRRTKLYEERDSMQLKSVEQSNANRQSTPPQQQPSGR